MFEVIGNHFPVFVVAGMALFALTLCGISIEDALKARSDRRDA